MASATELAPPPPSPPAGGNNPAARILTERLGRHVLKVDDFRGDLAITVDRRAWVDAALCLRDHPDLDFKLFLDLCGVDWLDVREERYEVVLHAYSVSKKHHVRLKAALPESDATLDTITHVYKGETLAVTVLPGTVVPTSPALFVRGRQITVIVRVKSASRTWVVIFDFL